MPTGFLAWHPKIHERFGERLFFFLLAMKSGRDETLPDKIRELLERCNVPTSTDAAGYCSYALLGDFDHLLRVWLPPDMDIKFLELARTLLKPDIILQFSVQRVVMDWRFAAPPAPADIDDLDLAEVDAAQKGMDNERALLAKAKRQAYWVTDKPLPEEGVTTDPVKAFICLRAPGYATDVFLDALQSQIISHLQTAPRIMRCTVHRGVGFTWLLAKIVAADFAALADLLTELGKRFSGLGLSTSTYAVTTAFVEGDSIRTSGNVVERVFQFWPALRHHEAKDADGLKRLRAVRTFVEDKILDVKLEGREREIMRNMLEAVLAGNTDHANEFLISPTIRMEREVRARVLALVSRQPGGIKEALEFLRQQHQEVKSPDTMSLGASLILARREIEKQLPQSPVPKQFPPKAIGKAVERRNRIMHGSPIDLDVEWQEMAEYLLFLFQMQPAFATALDACLHKPPDRA